MRFWTILWAFCLLPCAVAAGAGSSYDHAHRWGVTHVAPGAKRIVTLSYNGADALLALGLTPVAHRAWFGGDENGLWPWAAPLAEGAPPAPMRGEIDIEAVARLEPDLIEAMYSGVTFSEYRALSKIAPVLAPPEGDGDFGVTWDAMLRAIGAATGRAAEAEAVVAALDARIDGLRAAHPDWRGRTAVAATPDGPLIYGPRDVRASLLSRLGFAAPEAARRLARGGFFFRLDQELTAPLEADVVIWLDFGAGVGAVRDQPLRHTLRSAREGREIVAEPALAAALSYASPLSIGYALDRLAPRLGAALDGDPATPVEGAAELYR